jgi:excinuclease ABC subunit A
VHNLKNIDIAIPKTSWSFITGISGSGKSSLAFDTIYAEGKDVNWKPLALMPSVHR